MENNQAIYIQANNYLNKFLKEKSLGDAIKNYSGELPDLCIDDATFYFGNREILCMTDDLTYTWFIDSYGDRHTVELFDWSEQ
jgi:hypothetical protein